jgi:hypothetical protein
MESTEEGTRPKVDAPLLSGILGLRPSTLIALTLAAGPFLLMLPPRNRLRRWIARKTVERIRPVAGPEKQRNIHEFPERSTTATSAPRCAEISPPPQKEIVLR